MCASACATTASRRRTRRTASGRSATNMVRTAPTPISAGWPNSRAAAEPSARGDATRPPEGKGDQRDVKGISRRADDRQVAHERQGVLSARRGLIDDLQDGKPADERTEERRVGKEGCSKCKY